MNMSSLLRNITILRTLSSQIIFNRSLNTYKEKNVKRLGPRPSKKIIAQNESIRARGFLRPVPPYEPPSDANEKVKDICTKAGLSSSPETSIEDPVVRFNILKECAGQFNHAVPSSQLHTIETVGDLLSFYETPVVTTTPYDALKNMDLPKNIHVQQDYIRFHPDTDTMFNGVTAFPKSSTIVTGLTNKQRYPGYKLGLPWDKAIRQI